MERFSEVLLTRKNWKKTFISLESSSFLCATETKAL